MASGQFESIVLGGRMFPSADGASCNMKLGGYTAEVKVAGNGTTYNLLTRKPAMLTGLSVVFNMNAKDLEFIQGIIDSGVSTSFLITLVDGMVYGGTGTITGDPEADLQNGSIELEYTGSLERL